MNLAVALIERHYAAVAAARHKQSVGQEQAQQQGYDSSGNEHRAPHTVVAHDNGVFIVKLAYSEAHTHNVHRMDIFRGIYAGNRTIIGQLMVFGARGHAPAVVEVSEMLVEPYRGLRIVDSPDSVA